MKLIILFNFLLLSFAYQSNFNVSPKLYEENLSEEKSEMQPQSAITYSYSSAIYGEYIYTMNISRVIDNKRILKQEIIETEEEVNCEIIQNYITLEKELGLEFSLAVMDYAVVTDRVQSSFFVFVLILQDESTDRQKTQEQISKVFLLTNEMSLIVFVPNKAESKFSFHQQTDLISTSSKNKDFHMKLFNNKYLVIVTNYEILTVPITIQQKTDIIYEESLSNEDVIDSISSIKIFKIFQTNYLFINAKTQGLIIYELDSEGKMARISHLLNAELSAQTPLNITDSAFISPTLYCLDYTQGLHAMSLEQPFQLSVNHGYLISKIKKGKQIAHRDNTFIIATDQDAAVNNQAGIYEVFVYPPDKWILNHEELYPSTLKRVDIGHRYYLAVFSATHLIIPHSMFAEFMPQNFDTYISKYAFSHLLFGQFLNDEFEDAGQPELLHITSNGIYKHTFEESSFSIKCMTSGTAKSQTVVFDNEFVARKCSAKDEAHDNSVLNACLLKKQFAISVYHYIKDSETKYLALIIIGSVLIVLILLSLAFYVWYKKCHKPVKELEEKITYLKKIKYQNLSENPIENQNI